MAHTITLPLERRDLAERAASLEGRSASQASERSVVHDGPPGVAPQQVGPEEFLGDQVHRRLERRADLGAHVVRDETGRRWDLQQTGLLDEEGRALLRRLLPGGVVRRPGVRNARSRVQPWYPA